MLLSLKSLLEEHPGLNNYARILKTKENADIYAWVQSMCADNDDLNEVVYRLLNNVPVCAFGKTKKFLDYARGYGYCGRANICKCLQEKCGTTSKPIENLDQKNLRTAQTKNTKKEKYNNENYNNRAKSVDTLRANYGVDNPMNSDIIKAGLKSSVFIKYGVTNVMKDDAIKQRHRQSSIDKNGVFHTRAHLTHDVTDKLDDVLWLVSENATKTPLQIARELGVSDTTIYKIFNKHNIDYIRHYNSSIWQDEVVEYIKSITCTHVETNNRSILSGLELDILLPDIKLAIECNGVLWHSEVYGGKGSKYHSMKSELAEATGYKLVHLFDNEWHTSREIVKSRLSCLLSSNCKLYARNTHIRVVNPFDESVFFNNTHLQGYAASSICLGAYYGDELVAAMSFAKPRFNKHYEYELLRYSCKLFTNVTGAPSKLLSHFKGLVDPKSIISYSHRTFGRATLYSSLGFEFSHTSPPSYRYTKNYSKLENRVKFQKHKLATTLVLFDPNLTEWENMKANGYDRVWDCGNDVWSWIR